VILVADSGSTKTSWCLFNSSDKQYFSTSGINPYFLNKEDILNVLKNELFISERLVSQVYFYGSGCTPEKQAVVKAVLAQYFGIDRCEVYSDLLGAARSLCQSEEGIACILGTGSNSCYYDGENISENISPLGFILGDEGSGAVLGKILIADILKNQVSPAIRKDFYDSYAVSTAEIIDKVYREPFPNRYLAQFAPFAAKHIANPEIKELVERHFSAFIQRNVLQYEKTTRLPIHFTGSIAWHFKDNLENVLQKFNLQSGTITKEPLAGLVTYHQKKLHHD
jgi:N-acetylglucosamine kinase-like BadF-type ATPase